MGVIVEHKQIAPEGCTFARHAFDGALGKVVPFKVSGLKVGEATLIGAVPGTRYRTMTLTWRVEAIHAGFLDAIFDETLSPDDYTPDDAFNPAAALAALRRAAENLA